MRAVRSGGPTSHPTLVIALPPPPPATSSPPPAPPPHPTPGSTTLLQAAATHPLGLVRGTPPLALQPGALIPSRRPPSLREQSPSWGCAELPAGSGGGGKWFPVALRSLCFCSPPGGWRIGLRFQFCGSPSPSIFFIPGPGRGSCCVSTRCGPWLSKLVGTALLGDRGQPCLPVWPGYAVWGMKLRPESGIV